MFLGSSCSCLCPIQWSQVLSREWRRSCRRCSNYIWVIDNVIAQKNKCASYIRDLMVHSDLWTMATIINIMSEIPCHALCVGGGDGGLPTPGPWGGWMDEIVTPLSPWWLNIKQWSYCSLALSHQSILTWVQVCHHPHRVPADPGVQRTHPGMAPRLWSHAPAGQWQPDGWGSRRVAWGSLAVGLGRSMPCLWDNSMCY